MQCLLISELQSRAGTKRSGGPGAGQSVLGAYAVLLCKNSTWQKQYGWRGFRLAASALVFGVALDAACCTIGTRRAECSALLVLL